MKNFLTGVWLFCPCCQINLIKPNPHNPDEAWSMGIKRPKGAVSHSGERQLMSVFEDLEMRLNQLSFSRIAARVFFSPNLLLRI